MDRLKLIYRLIQHYGENGSYKILSTLEKLRKRVMPWRVT